MGKKKTRNTFYGCGVVRLQSNFYSRNIRPSCDQDSLCFLLSSDALCHKDKIFNRQTIRKSPFTHFTPFTCCRSLFIKEICFTPAFCCFSPICQNMVHFIEFSVFIFTEIVLCFGIICYIFVFFFNCEYFLCTHTLSNWGIERCCHSPIKRTCTNTHTAAKCRFARGSHQTKIRENTLLLPIGREQQNKNDEERLDYRTVVDGFSFLFAVLVVWTKNILYVHAVRGSVFTHTFTRTLN